MTPAEEKLIAVLREGLRLQSVPNITPDTQIFGKNGLGLDSVDVLEIAVLIDKHFGVVLEEQNQEIHSALHTIRTLAAYVDRHRKPM